MNETSVERYRWFVDALSDGIMLVTAHKDGDMEGYVFTIVARDGTQSVPIIVMKNEFDAFINQMTPDTNYNA